jgi:hypothetical protein
MVKFCDIHDNLKEGELYKSLLESIDNENDEIEIEERYVINNFSIKNNDDFHRILQICSYWLLNKLPVEIYIYSFLHRENVLTYINNLNEEISHERQYKEDLLYNIGLIQNKKEIIKNVTNEKNTPNSEKQENMTNEENATNSEKQENVTNEENATNEKNTPNSEKEKKQNLQELENTEYYEFKIESKVEEKQMLFLLGDMNEIITNDTLTLVLHIFIENVKEKEINFTFSKINVIDLEKLTEILMFKEISSFLYNEALSSQCEYGNIQLYENEITIYDLTIYVTKYNIDYLAKKFNEIYENMMDCLVTLFPIKYISPLHILQIKIINDISLYKEEKYKEKLISLLKMHINTIETVLDLEDKFDYIFKCMR